MTLKLENCFLLYLANGGLITPPCGVPLPCF